MLLMYQKRGFLLQKCDKEKKRKEKESKYTTATTRVRGAERRTAEFG